jgi:hypothetical protein
MRSKALRNQVQGVRFVEFPAGARLTIPESVAGNYCLLIESGACCAARSPAAAAPCLVAVCGSRACMPASLIAMIG